MSWRLLYTKQARKDAKKLAAAGLKPKAQEPLGVLTGAFSRRITIQHRLVYQVLADEHAVKVLRMWTHFE